MAIEPVTYFYAPPVFRSVMAAGCALVGWTKHNVNVLGPPVVGVLPPVCVTSRAQLGGVSASVEGQQNALPSKLVRHRDL
jgi:hypothetical protein